MDSERKLKIIRVIYYILNCLFFIAAILLLAAGAYSLSGGNTISGFRFQLPTGAGVVILMSGIFLFAVTVLGIWGGVKTQRVVLLIYAILMAVLFLMELIGGIVAGAANSALGTALSNAWDQTDNQSKINLQEELGCCGFYDTGDRAVQPCNGTVGCFQALNEFFSTRAGFVAAVGILFALFQLVALILALIIRHKAGAPRFDSHGFPTEEDSTHA